MTWIKGEIVGFEGQGKEKLRRIKTAPSQAWKQMHFFHIRQALDAGYSHEHRGRGQAEFPLDGQQIDDRTDEFLERLSLTTQ